MQKTGESYTAARAHLLSHRKPPASRAASAEASKSRTVPAPRSRGSTEVSLTMVGAVSSDPDALRRSLFAAWRTNNRVTIYLIERLPAELWRASLPGAPRRTVGMMAAHLHNARSRWIRTLGSAFGVTAPRQVEARRVTQRQLIPALRRSGEGILALLRIGCERGGTIPPTALYAWRNLPLDVGHVLTYFVAHEAHHRGQLVMAARALGARLPDEVTEGLWQWHRRAVEAGGTR